MKTIWPEGLKGVELFKFLKQNKTAIMDMKKSVMKEADIVSLNPGTPALPAHLMKHKGYLFTNNEEKGELERTIVMNSYNWLDSHDDVHQNNLFAKSIADRGARIPHLHDHEFKLDARVGMPISWSEKNIAWKELGVDKEGDTQALILESKILRDLNKAVYRDYLNNIIDQHSVKMSYMELGMAINDADYEEEYKVWQETYPKLGNPEAAAAQGYYFAIRTAKLYEGSAVLLGSNEVTPVLGNKFEPAKTTQKTEPKKVSFSMADLVDSCYKL